MRTVVLVLTDVQGSTSLWREAPDAMDLAMTRHTEIVAAVVRDHGGWRPLEQGEGDSAFLAFDSAVDAVAAALELQRAFRREPWPTPTPLTVRIGIHVGDVISRDGNLYGETVGRCARIRDAGHGGQTLLSTAAADLVRQQLPAGASLRSLGRHRLRDLVHPEGIWQLDHPDLPAEFPPLRSLDRGRHNLPVQLTSFVGRDEEVADLTQRLSDGARLATVTGFGGMGKTRLALAVAAALVDGTGDGVWFVDLSGTSDPLLVPREVAAVLGVRDTGQGMEQAVTDHLRWKRLLLVLDNLEQVLGCAPFVARLLAQAPEVQVLATSRKALGIRGEVVFGLQPFPLPRPTEPTETPVDEVAGSTYAAVTLFIERARDARRDFVVGNDNAAAVAAICARLDGVPLAIELAAARISMLTPAALLSRLERSLGVLAAVEHDRPERHRTVRATVAWSYDLLTPEEQALLARLSVFPGTADLDAVEAVCAEIPGEPALDVFPLMASLLDANLVRRSEQEGEARFSLLVSVREFAAEQLLPAAHDALADAHLQHYLERSVAGAATGDGPDEHPWYEEMHRDVHNFRTALDRAEATGRSYEHLLLAANLFDLWGLGGHRVEGYERLARARRLAGDAGADRALVAFACCAEAWLASATGAAITDDLVRRAVELADAAGDLPVLSFAFQILGFSLADRLDAREANERAVETARKVRQHGAVIRWGSTRPDAVEIGASLWLVAFHRWIDPARALELAHGLRHRAAEAGREGDVAYVDYRLGELASDVGHVAAAVALFDRAVAAFERRRDDLYVAQGVLARQRARVRAGEEPVGTLLPVIDRYRQVVNTTNLAAAELLVGDLRAVAGDLEEAADAYRRAIGSQESAPAGWRLLRLDRLAGGDTRDALEALYRAHHDDWRWKRPDLLGCLVEAAVVAEQHERPDRAAELTAAVQGLRGSFLLPEVVLGDLAGLAERHAGAGSRTELPDMLFGG